MEDFFEKLKKTNCTKNTILDLVNELTQDPNWIEHTSKKNIQKISTFLCQMNHLSALKIILLVCLNKIEKLPGDALFYFLVKHNRFAIIDAFYELNNEFSFFKVYMNPFSLNQERYADHIAKQKDVYYQRYTKTKEDLIDKLQFARTQRLDAEVKKTLEKLLEAFPNDPSFKNEKHSYFEKEAERIIDSRAKQFVNNKKNKITSTKPISLFNAEEVYNILKSQFIPSNVEYLLDTFLLSGEEDIAINILNENPSLKIKFFWNYIEFLINKNRHLDALVQIRNTKVEKTSENNFNYYYYSSICLWTLNDKSTALEMMKSIAAVKPNFKQTLLYLSEWQRSNEVA